MTLTKEIIKERLRSIVTPYNKYLLDDATIETYSDHIFQNKDGVEHSEKEKELHLSFLIHDHSRNVVKEYSHISVVKNLDGRYYIYTNKRKYPFIELYVPNKNDKNYQERYDLVFSVADITNKIHDRKYVSCDIEFPTGEILFSNYFISKSGDDYAFPVPEEIKYSELTSINHSFGEQNTMKILSETHGLGYVQLGNTSAAVYKVNDDKIVITREYFYNSKTDEEILSQQPGWECLGYVSCDVWRVEFIDKQNFNKVECLSFDDNKYECKRPFTGKVNPGKWKIINRYHFLDDDEEIKKGNIPLWITLERIK